MGMMIICPSCKRETMAGMRFCRNCGRLLGEPDLDAAFAPVAPLFDRASDLNDLMGDVTGDGDANARFADVTRARLAIYVYPTDEYGQVTGLAAPLGEYALEGRDVTIGRGKGSDIVLEGDTLTSRRHAMLRRDHDRYIVVDLGSSNGTLLNGAELSEAAPLQPGDRVQVGNHELVYLLDAAPQPVPQSASQPAPHSALHAGPPSASAASHTTGSMAAPAPSGLPDARETPPWPAPAGQAQPEPARPASSSAGVNGASSAPGIDSTGAQTAVSITRVTTQTAPTRRASAANLSGIRAQLAEASEALEQEARAHAALADQMRDALAQASARLREVAADLRRPAAPPVASAASLIGLARHVRQSPNDLERLRAFADHADDIAAALESVGQTDRAAAALDELSAWLDAQAEDAQAEDAQPAPLAAEDQTTTGE